MQNAVVVSLGVIAACCTACSSGGVSSSTPVSEYISKQVQNVSSTEHISGGGTYVAYGSTIVLDTTEPITLILHDSSLESISGGQDVTLSLSGTSEVESLSVGGTVSIMGSGSLVITNELEAERAIVNSGVLSTQEHTEVSCDIERLGQATQFEHESNSTNVSAEATSAQLDPAA